MAHQAVVLQRNAALLLVDVQRDYLAHPGLTPALGALLARIAHLLAACRARGIPVVHAHTRIDAAGKERMRHLRRDGIWWCVEGTFGAEAPPEAAPLPDEAVFHKTVFNAFSSPGLGSYLAQLGVDTLVIAGLHLHACVRETALAAYQKGFRVLIPDDAVASYDPLHAEVTREYLSSRGMELLSGERIFAQVGAPAVPASSQAAPPRCTSAWIGGRWLRREGGMAWGNRRPARWDEVLGVVAEASPKQLDRAVSKAAAARRLWAAKAPEERGERLAAFAAALAARRELIALAMSQEIGKPLRDGRAEVARAIELIGIAVSELCAAKPWEGCAAGVHARRVAVGVVAAITPFNHPLGIAVGKLAPALALGNALVWKPALPAVATTQLTVEALAEAGIPGGLVSVLFGDGYTAQRLARHPGVAAVSVTASVAAGRQLALTCAASLKPLQAELGGNNAVVVMGDADIPRVAVELARSAFSFAGQRCTAGRRILIERDCHGVMLDALVAATNSLRLGEPDEETTEVGPLISRAQQRAVAAAVAGAAQGGARVVCGGAPPAGFDRGCWYLPTIVDGVAADSPLFREESFGPVAVVRPFSDLDEALQLVNGVPQGLVATFYGVDPAAQRRFLAEAQAGVVKLNCPPSGVIAEAPFGGWKDSGFGPPEHGRWDEEFCTRPQALYGFEHHLPDL